MTAKDIVTEIAEAYLADGWDSVTFRSEREAGDLFTEPVADRMEQIEVASRG